MIYDVMRVEFLVYSLVCRILIVVHFEILLESEICVMKADGGWMGRGHRSNVNTSRRPSFKWMVSLLFEMLGRLTLNEEA
jgi:hypothetical protein